VLNVTEEKSLLLAYVNLINIWKNCLVFNFLLFLFVYFFPISGAHFCQRIPSLTLITTDLIATYLFTLLLALLIQKQFLQRSNFLWTFQAKIYDSIRLFTVWVRDHLAYEIMQIIEIFTEFTDISFLMSTERYSNSRNFRNASILGAINTIHFMTKQALIYPSTADFAVLIAYWLTYSIWIWIEERTT